MLLTVHFLWLAELFSGCLLSSPDVNRKRCVPPSPLVYFYFSSICFCYLFFGTNNCLRRLRPFCLVWMTTEWTLLSVRRRYAIGSAMANQTNDFSLKTLVALPHSAGMGARCSAYVPPALFWFLRCTPLPPLFARGRHPCIWRVNALEGSKWCACWSRKARMSTLKRYTDRRHSFRNATSFDDLILFRSQGVRSCPDARCCGVCWPFPCFVFFVFVPHPLIVWLNIASMSPPRKIPIVNLLTHSPSSLFSSPASTWHHQHKSEGLISCFNSPCLSFPNLLHSCVAQLCNLIVELPNSTYFVQISSFEGSDSSRSFFVMCVGFAATAGWCTLPCVQIWHAWT